MVNDTRLDVVVSENIEGLCRHFFSHGKCFSGEWKIADITAAEGNSLGIQLTGPRSGLWHDRATGQGGTFVQLLMANRSLSSTGAVNEIKSAVGIDLKLAKSFLRRPTSVNKLPPIASWGGVP